MKKIFRKFYEKALTLLGRLAEWIHYAFFKNLHKEEWEELTQKAAKMEEEKASLEWMEKMRKGVQTEDKKQIDELEKQIQKMQKKNVDKGKLSELHEQKEVLEQTLLIKEVKIMEIIHYNSTVGGNASRFYRKALELVVKNRLDEALALLEKNTAPSGGKYSAGEYVLKAQLYNLKNDLENAEANFLKAVESDSSFDNNLQIANFYYQQMKAQAAEPYYASCLKLARSKEEKASLLSKLGGLYKIMQNYPKAVKVHREALEIYRYLSAIHPQYYHTEIVQIASSLAILHLKVVPNRKRSVQYAKEALSYRSSVENIPHVQQSIANMEQIIRRLNKK